MAYSGVQWCTVVYSGVQWCTVVYCGVLCVVWYKHKKVGKGDQIGGNSVLTTDGQTDSRTETQVQVLSCAAAPLQLKIISSERVVQFLDKFKFEQITKIYSYSCTGCFMLMQSSATDKA